MTHHDIVDNRIKTGNQNRSHNYIAVSISAQINSYSQYKIFTKEYSTCTCLGPERRQYNHVIRATVDFLIALYRQLKPWLEMLGPRAVFDLFKNKWGGDCSAPLGWQHKVGIRGYHLQKFFENAVCDTVHFGNERVIFCHIKYLNFGYFLYVSDVL